MANRPMNWMREAEVERVREATANLYGKMSLRDIAREIDCGVSSVQWAAKRLGLPPRPVSLAPDQGSRPRYSPHKGTHKPRILVTLTCSGCGYQRDLDPARIAERLSDYCKSCAAKNRRRA